MNYVRFMRGADVALKYMSWKEAVCPRCGGTGVDAVMCCCGQECGCFGKPIDYEPCSCGRKPPPWWDREYEA